MSSLIRASVKPTATPKKIFPKKTTSSVKGPSLMPIGRPNDYLSVAEQRQWSSRHDWIYLCCR